jgi:hypothetical protein
VQPHRYYTRDTPADHLARADKIWWVAGRAKLEKVAIKDGTIWTIAGKTFSFDPAKRVMHHVIPWEFVNPEKSQNALLILASQKGWHPSNPLMNGFPVLKNLHLAASGAKNHNKYSSYISRRLKDIWVELPDQTDAAVAKNKVDQLYSELLEYLADAEAKGLTLDDYVTLVLKFN